MDYRNADGSPAEMCGNGARCVARFVRDLGATDADAFDLVTGAGRRRVELRPDGRVTVWMGPANLTKAAIPMRGPAWETFVGESLQVGELTFVATAVSMGNPHLVLFVDEDPSRYHVAHIGPTLERDDRFPEGTNVELVRPEADGALKERVWERGSGETMACDSGACAIAVAAFERGIAGSIAVVRFPGGDLEVERRDDGEMLLTGGAVHVFDGVAGLPDLPR